MSTHDTFLPTSEVAAVPPAPLPLETGDVLMRDEFEQRYDAMPELKKAELIEGVAYVSSAVRWNRHARPHIRLAGWLLLYEEGTLGVECGDNSSIRLDLENEPQPDAAMIIAATHGGKVRISEDDFVIGAPELVVEVSASSAAFDLNHKLRLYRRHQVREYLVWRVLDKQVDWFVMRSGRFEQLPCDTVGVIRSEVFPGLWLDTSALMQPDLTTMLAVLQQGMASPEHAAFVDRLLQAAGQQGRG